MAGAEAAMMVRIFATVAASVTSNLSLPHRDLW
jgi:hypothetical protein